MDVRPEEFVPAREASRRLGRLLDRLDAGELAKAVIVDRNTPRAVVLTLARYEAGGAADTTPPSPDIAPQPGGPSSDPSQPTPSSSS